MKKPKEILELEKAWGIELERDNSDEENNRTYLLNEEGDLIRIFATGCEIKDISGLQNLKALTNLNLSNNQIKDISPLRNLKELSVLFLDNNQITDISPLQDLKTLVILSLNNNQIKKISALQNLNALFYLYLSHNQIADISVLQELKALSGVHLDNNNITDISTLSNLTSIMFIRLINNPIEGTTISDFNDLKAIKGYFASLKEGDYLVENYDVKINIIGTGRIGKTQLFKFLQNKKYVKDEPITHGTGVGLYIFTDAETKVNYKSSLWDFGGQSYQHGTHSIFLRQRDFNIVLHRDKDEVYNYGYWIGAARTFADVQIEERYTEPLLVVQNQWTSEDDKIVYPSSDKMETYQVNLNELFVLDIEQIHLYKNPAWNARKEYFIETLQERIKQHAASFGKVPKEFVNIKDRVIRKNDGSIYTSKETFRKEYASNMDDNMFAYLLQYLEFTGTILYFRENEKLNLFVFNNPQVLSNWIYNTILDKEFLDKANGVLDFQKLFDSKEKEKSAIFLGLMREFNLAFPEKKTSQEVENYNLIIPQFLPENNNTFKKVLLDLVPFTFSIRFEDFIYEGRIFNFLATYGEFADDKSAYWKYGILFTKDKVQAIVYYDVDQRTVNVHIGKGKNRLEIAQEIFDFFVYKPTQIKILDIEKSQNLIDKVVKKQLDDVDFTGQNIAFKLLDNIKNDPNYSAPMQYKELRDTNPIIGSQLSTNNTNFIDIATTIKTKDSNLFVGYCLQQKKNVELDFLAIKLMGLRTEKQYKIFISYAKENKPQVNDFLKQIAPFKLTREVETWHCSELELGQDWEAKIKEKFDEANIILYFISTDFCSTPFILDVEVKRGFERLEDENDNVVLVPIILENIHWEGILGQLTSNYKGIPINAYDKSTEAWYDIVDDLIVQQVRKRDLNSTSAILGQSKAKMKRQEEILKK